MFKYIEMALVQYTKVILIWKIFMDRNEETKIDKMEWL